MTDLSREDIEFIKELREKHEDGKVSRRQALAGLGAVGVGAAGGFFGAGTASASDHDDSQGNIGTASDPVDGWFDTINPPGGPGSGNSTYITSLSADEGDIGGTAVKAHLPSQQSYAAADNWVTVPLEASNSGDQDALGEWDDTNNQFTPDSSGEYFISMSVRADGTVDGDWVRIRFQDVDNTQPILMDDMTSGGSDRETPKNSKKERLIAGTSYELQFRDHNNDCTIRESDYTTFLTIREAFEGN